ncbi:MAG: trypsin-like peptidase domain-containing protein [Gammaproteobacteria bacterium]|nr:trypsin-like peptidase domain-containing protein [Gammaproteobacteria bacterium]
MDSQSVFESRERAVFQIRVISRETGKKASIGSGFVFDRPDQLATNYHVVSGYIEKPDVFHLRYLAADGTEGDLELVSVDAVHDLALVRATAALGTPLTIAEPPAKGARLYAMGNPLDLGLTIAEGTNGGVLSQTDASRILFSGSLNPGMSGGPTFDDQGRVVGINVSTARNDISFIVPSRFLLSLPNQSQTVEAIKDAIGRQVNGYQQDYLERIVGTSWETTSVRQMYVPGSISPTIRCWDASPKKKDEQLYRRFSISCKNENDIFLSDRLEVGKVLYEYNWIETDQLDPLRFYRAYEALNTSQFGGRAKEDDVERFDCDTRFVDVNGQPFKTTLCSRAYKSYPQLHDVLFTAAMVGKDNTGFIFNLDLAGTDLQTAIRLITRMLGEIRWQP